jgi:hypothetical protein
MKYDPNLGRQNEYLSIKQKKADQLAIDAISHYKHIQSFGDDEILVKEYRKDIQSKGTQF